jgi:hypothetical protein
VCEPRSAARSQLIPGMIDSRTDYIEHPRSIADRLVRYAKVVGRENIVASTDCGLGSLATLPTWSPSCMGQTPKPGRGCPACVRRPLEDVTKRR